MPRTSRAHRRPRELPDHLLPLSKMTGDEPPQNMKEYDPEWLGTPAGSALRRLGRVRARPDREDGISIDVSFLLAQGPFHARPGHRALYEDARSLGNDTCRLYRTRIGSGA